MPRYTPAQFRWSEHAQNYVLSLDGENRTQALSSAWLEQIASFSFHSRSGMHYTVRKQKVQRGGSYWYGYRRLHGRITKRYLGRTADLTLARLEKVAQFLENESAVRLPASQPEQAVDLPHSTPGGVHADDIQHPTPVDVTPLMLSRLAPPRLPAFLLDRSRLYALLDIGRTHPLTLLSAPAGFGKTTLVCQWLSARRASHDFPPLAWLSLEASDNDPARFWRYLSAACQAFQVDLAQVYSALAATNPQPPFLRSSLESMVTTLLNVLTQAPTGGILVLEDYHLITSPEIHETVAFFLDHLPVTIHLIMITRSDPPFALARWRARNVLYEIRTADLSFSHEETGILLHQALPFSLTDEAIRSLHAQLEGWGAGLHLIKLALQRSTTPAEEEQALALFAHHNASLQAYFVAEVLDLQPEPVQLFLLQTSILARLTPSLCDAVTEQSNSRELLAQLEHLHLFLEPLASATLALSENTRPWYRYHALFSEAMRAEAQRRFGVEHLHLLSARASRWYEAHGSPDAAIEAALDALDYPRAANLIEQSSHEHASPGEISEPHTLQHWLEQFPEAILAEHPVLCLSYASTLLFMSLSWLPDASTLRSLEKLLQSAEQHFLQANSWPELGELRALRSVIALRQGDTQAALSHARQALEHLEPAQRAWRGICLCIASEEWIVQGRFQQARVALYEAYALCEAVHNSYFQQIARLKLAQVLFELAEFQQAAVLYRQVLAESRPENPLYMRCNALIGLATLSYISNDLEKASQHAQEALTVNQSRQLLYPAVRATLILARVQQAEGQIFVAQQQLAALLEKIPLSLPHLAREIQTAQARLALASGDQLTLQRWATDRSPRPDFSQAREEELLLCRWLRMQGKLEEASHQLERLLTVAREMGHTRLALEIQVEMALVAVAGKRKPEAQQLLRAVLAQAVVSNAPRLFLDAGEQMAILLRTLLPQIHEQPVLTSIRALLEAFPGQQNGTPAQAAALLEPLSPQEMRVLRLLVQRRSNAEIARELVVSVNTVRTQVQSIYGKLGVHTRSAASDVARELHLLS